MNKKLLVLLLSATLLVSCGKKKEKEVEASAPAASSVTGVSGTASVQQLGDEEVKVAQKEFLQILSVKDEAMAKVLQLGQSVGQAQFDEKAMKEIQAKMFQYSLDTQKKISGLKITNQEVKNYVEALGNLTAVGEKVYKAQDHIAKEQKSGKLSESSEALLKEMQEAQAKVLQQEVALNEKLAQNGDQSPAKELLQIKSIQNKEALQLAGSMQMLMSDASAGEEEKAKKLVEASTKITESTVAELNKLTIKTPEIEAYRKELLDLSRLKAESISKSEQIQKELQNNKKLSPASEELMKKVQEKTLQSEKTRMELTARYAN